MNKKKIEFKEMEMGFSLHNLVLGMEITFQLRKIAFIPILGSLIGVGHVIGSFKTRFSPSLRLRLYVFIDVET